MLPQRENFLLLICINFLLRDFALEIPAPQVYWASPHMP